MNKNKSASLEARLKNSKDLVVSVREMSLYDPSAEEIKKENYERFVDEVDAAITPLKTASGFVSAAKNKENVSFSNLVKKSKLVRYEINEMKNNKSPESIQVDSIVKLITGENISEHSRMKKKVISSLKEGEVKPEFASVSALSHKDQLGNFRTLIGKLRAFEFYLPTDPGVTIASLEALEEELNSRLVESAERERDYAQEKSKVEHYFDDVNGLMDRARRAKSHVKRKYGTQSREYKLLTKKKY